MRRLLTILFSLLLFLPVSRSNALIFGADTRVVASTRPGSLFSPIGIVYPPDQSAYATAFLIDDCHALTVQHVFGDSLPAKGRAAVIALNVDGPMKSWAVTGAKVIADGALQTMRTVAPAARFGDWALLRLNKCLGRRYGHILLNSGPPSAGETIGSAGFPRDRPLGEGLSVEMGCHIRARHGLTILHDCASLPGNSGSPMFRIVERKGRPMLQAFAIVEAAHSTKDVGRDFLDARDDYPDVIWNVGTVLCGNPNVQAAGVRCAG